jgi:mannose-1-phosphate guanylyltransferase
MNNIYSLIMAGGSGTRFWPRSREKKPKQFLSILGKETLLQASVNRFLQITTKENIYIISKLVQKEEIAKQNLPINPENILYEPIGKNTLPAIGLASLFIQKKDPHGIVIVSPADHLVDNQPAFREAINAACRIASNYDGIVTIGITPSYPSTGYGYISIDKEIDSGSGIKAFKVNRFVEKPDIETAVMYCSKGEYFWNSGLFVFKCSVLWDAIRKYTPSIYGSLKEIGNHLDSPNYFEEISTIYNTINGVSIDYAIMEKSVNTYLVKGDFLWNDLGSWEQIYEIAEKDEFKNASEGQVMFEDTENSYVYSHDGIIALIGVKDLLVIQDGNATLVCKRERAEDVKKLVERMKSLGLKEYI